MSADSAAWVAAWAGTASAVLTAVSAGGVLWAARIAQKAASTWRGVHEHAKADECVAAAFDCKHAVNRVISKRWEIDTAQPSTSMATVQFPSAAYDEAWASWRRFQLAHVIARRYFSEKLNEDAPKKIATLLEELGSWCKTYYGPFSDTGQHDTVQLRVAATNRSDAIVAAVTKEAETIRAALTPVP